jgi:inosine/xanthosine triphosphatase
MKVIIASKNPTKIEATKNGFQKVWTEKTFQFEGISIPSGVPDQPFGSEETFTGAMNRAQGAKKEQPDADFWVGIEGGNIRHDQEMEAMAWVVILSKKHTGKARTAGFFLSTQVINLINKGYELGHADEIVFGIENSKQKMGSSGLLTDNVIDRIDFYVPAVVFALIPFNKPVLYY